MSIQKYRESLPIVGNPVPLPRGEKAKIGGDGKRTIPMSHRSQEMFARAEKKIKSLTLDHYTLALAVVWILVISVSMVWNIHRAQQTTQKMALREAMANFNKDQAFRSWATLHGGVYVPVDQRTPPSPFLSHLPDRDVTTASGKTLTLMNPAYMLRQIHEDFGQLYGVAGHITSLKPLRPENRADEWERTALLSFEKGAKEAWEFTTIDGKPYLRFMRPMHIQKGCLKCHGHQVYTVGEVRGGVSLSVPLATYLASERKELKNLVLTHVFLCVLGLMGIGVGWRQLRQKSNQRDQALFALQDAHGELEERVQKRTAELKYTNDRLTREIAEREQTEKGLAEREATLRSILRAAPTGIGMLCNRIIKQANDRICEMTGYSSEELLGQSAKMLYLTEEEFELVGQEKYSQISKQGTGTVETRWRRKDGEVIDVQLSLAPIDPEDLSVGVTFTALDITERKRAEVALARKTEELACSNAELEQFAYVASHDLQEPLRMVSSYVQLLARRYKEKLDSDADDFITFAVDGANRMQSLIRDLLAYSRVGTKGKGFEPTPCESVLDITLANLQFAIEENAARVTHDPLPTVLADPSQLAQLFQNLIANAIKFRRQEAPHVHLAAERHENEWLFSIRDNGIGIDEEYRERIFEIFQRLHGRNDYPGTGIGLALCKKIVERHGGRIWVMSDPGRGSTFHFTLPSESEN
jgi:chemotaxis family two-component system sensor kinase Cph1